MRKIFILFIVCNIIITGCHKSESKNDEVDIVKSSKDPKVEIFLKQFESQFIKTFKRSGAPGAVVSVVVDGQRFSKGYGIRDLKTGKKVDQNTIFRIGSLSKGFAAVLSGIAVEEGKLDFEEKVQDILPEFKLKDSLQSARINIKHLLSHSTGLPRHSYTNLVEADVPMKKIIEELANVDLIAKEGEIYSYQNAAFGIIEKVLEKKTHLNFSELIREKIFLPAKMTRSTTEHLDLLSDSNVALPHLYSGKKYGFVRGKLSDKYFNLASTGGIASSGHDMSIWLNILLGNHPEIISDKTLDLVFEPILPTKSRKYYDRWSEHPTEYALGWRKINLDSTQIMHHTGFVNNYRSEIAIDRKNKIGICILFNSFVAEAKEVVPAFLNAFGENLLEGKNIEGDQTPEILPAN